MGIIGFAVSYVLGALLAFKFSINFAIILIIATIILIIVEALFKKQFKLDKTVSILLFCAGILFTQLSSFPSSKDLNKYLNKYVTVTGRISEIPYPKGDNVSYVISTKTLNCSGKTVKIREKLLISADKYYKYGDTIIVTGFIDELPNKLNESGFDLKLYYKSKDIFFRMYALESGLSTEKIRDYSIYSLVTSLKNSISDLLAKYTSGDDYQILKAIITGERTDFSDDFDRLLVRTGTKRFFYPAFLHISLLMSIISLFKGVVRKRVRDIVSIFLLIIYAVAQSNHPVMIKTCILTSIMIAFKGRLGYLYFKDALGLLLLIIGIANPLMLYNACFITSVVASLLISSFYKFAFDKLSFIKNGYIRRSLALGLICNIGLLPLSAYYFSGITIYNIVFGMVFLPLTFVIMVVSVPLLLMLWIFGTAPLISELITTILWLYKKIPMLIDWLPFSYFTIPKPNLNGILAFYAGLYALRLYINKDKFRAQVAFTISLGLMIVLTFAQISRMGTMEIDFVNVSQGDGAIISIPYKNTILLDGGGGTAYNEEYNPGEDIYLPYLESKGVNIIDCAIVSHCHKDHIEGIVAAIENLTVRHLYMPKLLSDNKYGKLLTDAASRFGTKVHYVERDTVLRFKSGLIIDITVPKGSALLSEDENDTSILTKVSFGEVDALFTGDMSKLSEYNMLKYNEVKPAEILKVAHHGSKSSSTEEFINTVSPLISVISVGADNTYGHPADEVLLRLKNSRIYRTDINGDIKIIANKNGIKTVNTYKE